MPILLWEGKNVVRIVKDANCCNYWLVHSTFCSECSGKALNCKCAF